MIPSCWRKCCNSITLLTFSKIFSFFYLLFYPAFSIIVAVSIVSQMKYISWIQITLRFNDHFIDSSYKAFHHKIIFRWMKFMYLKITGLSVSVTFKRNYLCGFCAVFSSMCSSMCAINLRVDSETPVNYQILLLLLIPRSTNCI